MTPGFIFIGIPYKDAAKLKEKYEKIETPMKLPRLVLIDDNEIKAFFSEQTH